MVLLALITGAGGVSALLAPVAFGAGAVLVRGIMKNRNRRTKATTATNATIQPAVFVFEPF